MIIGLHKGLVFFLQVVVVLILCNQEIGDASAEINYQYVKDSLGDNPGYGQETTGKGPVHQPMAYGLAAWAASNRGDEKLARYAADWLVESVNPEKPGWGLGWEWDAFADGTVNPPETVYGITTAIVVEGLVGAFKITNDIRYMDAAKKALNYYVKFRSASTGHFYYSDQPSDAAYTLPNITAMLMAQYACIGSRYNDELFLKVARDAYGALKNDSIKVGNFLKWNYATGYKKNRDNDLVHSAYIVYGIYKYEKCVDDNSALGSLAMEYLNGFVSDDVSEFHIDSSQYKESVKARSWGVGMLLYMLSLSKDNDLFDVVRGRLLEYEYEPMFFSYRRGDRLHVPRSVAHILLGLSLK